MPRSAWANGCAAGSDEKGKTVLKGYFGSLYDQILVLRVPDHAWWYVLQVSDPALRWAMYCNDAALAPAHSGETTDVECLGQRYRFRCWRVSPAAYVSESMQIADELVAFRKQHNAEAQPLP